MTDDTDRGPIPGPTVPGIRASGRKVNLSDNPGKITIFTLFILIPAFLFDFYIIYFSHCKTSPYGANIDLITKKTTVPNMRDTQVHVRNLFTIGTLTTLPNKKNVAKNVHIILITYHFK